MSMAMKAMNQNRNRNPPVNSCKRICDLPDDLLRRVLGMLPMKDAVRTRVLSRRWEYVWTSLTDLIFDQSECHDRMLFLNFVERAILLRDCSSIRVFSLRCALDNGDASSLNACLDAAIKHNVQDLKLKLYSVIEPSALPSCLFRCEMLTQLDLFFPGTLRVPSSVCFSSLKFLTLEYVKFVDDVSTGKMFSGAALERLSLFNCDLADLRVLNISAPKLWRLCIKKTPHDGDRRSNYNCKIMIHGPSLTHFCCLGGLHLYDLAISGSSIPVEATIHVDHPSYAPSDLAERWHRALKGLANANFLDLRSLSLQIVHDALPVFRNLNTLILSIRVMCLSSPSLAAILRRSPCLVNLEFTQGLHVDHRSVDGILDPPPPCFSSSLKRVLIGAFFGTEAEMLALRIFLRTAIAVKHIVLRYPGDLSESFEDRLLEDLEKLERQGHCGLYLVGRLSTEEQEGTEDEIGSVGTDGTEDD